MAFSSNDAPLPHMVPRIDLPLSVDESPSQSEADVIGSTPETTPRWRGAQPCFNTTKGNVMLMCAALPLPGAVCPQTVWHEQQACPIESHHCFGSPLRTAPMNRSQPAETWPSRISSTAEGWFEGYWGHARAGSAQNHSVESDSFVGTPESTPRWRGSEASSDVEVRSERSCASLSGVSRDASASRSRCASSDRSDIRNNNIKSSKKQRFTSKTFSTVDCSSMMSEKKIADLMCRLDKGGKDMHQAMGEMRGHVLQMALEPSGCRVVQRAFQKAKTVANDEEGMMDYTRMLVAELRGHVLDLLSSKYGNFTLSEAIDQFPFALTFVVDEISHVVGEVARHPFGCRVLESLIDHGCAPVHLIEKLLREVNALICNDYGIYILISILKRRDSTHNHCIAKAICRKTYHHARAKKASKVVDKALVYCDDADKRTIALNLLADPEGLLQIAMCEGGCFVVKELLLANVSCTDHRSRQTTTISDLAKSSLTNATDGISRLRSSKGGRKLLAELTQAGVLLDDAAHDR